LEVFCEDALLWTDDDFLGPLHVETRNGEELVESPPPPWIDRFEVAEALAKPLAQYAEPSKIFLDALARDGARAHGHPDVGVAIAAHRLVDRAYQSAGAGGQPVPCDPSPG
jgi:predicted dehydrogenase